MISPGRVPRQRALGGILILLALVLFAACEDLEDLVKTPQYSYVIGDAQNESGGKALYSYLMDNTSGLPELIGSAADYSPDNMKAFAISHSEKYLYLLTGDDHIITYSVKHDTGFLQAIGSPVKVNPSGNSAGSMYRISVDPLDQYVYVFAMLSNDNMLNNGKLYDFTLIETYSMDKDTGLLTFKNIEVLDAHPFSQIVFTQSGNYAYVASQIPDYAIVQCDPGPPFVAILSNLPTGVIYIYEVDRVRGSFRLKDSVSYNPWLVTGDNPITLDPNGKFMYINESSGYCVVKSSSSCPGYTTYDQTGSKVQTYLIDHSTGDLISSRAGFNNQPEITTWGASHPSGEFVYHINSYDSRQADYGVCQSYLKVPGYIYSYYVQYGSGEMTLTGITEAGVGSVSVQVEPSGRFLYMMNSSDIYVYNIDQATGELEVVGEPVSGAQEFSIPGKAYTFPLSLIGY